MSKSRLIFISFLVFSVPALVAAADSVSQQTIDEKRMDQVGIVVPYVGSLSSVYRTPLLKTEMKDSGFISGLFGQWIDPGRFQANAFGYWSPEVNYGRVLGGHFNVDATFAQTDRFEFIAGVDVEDINIRIDAGSNIQGLDQFSMNNNVFIAMARAGVASRRSWGPFRLSVFPYFAASRETVSGELRLDPRGRAPMRIVDISDFDIYPSAGINFSVRAFHFLEAQLKYLGGFRSADRQDSYSVLFNAYVSRNFALSYRGKWMDLPAQGAEDYHLFGIAYLF